MVTGMSRSLAAARVMAAASGSWNTLNSATAVTLPDEAEPPMKTIRSIPAATSGWVRSSSAMLVCGPVATSVTSSPLPIAAEQFVVQQVDRGERGGAAVGGPGEPAEPVLAVKMPGVRNRGQQRRGRAAADRDVVGAGGVQHVTGVGDDVVDRRVAGDAGHRAQVDPGMADGEHQRERVVDPGVDVHDDRHRGVGGGRSRRGVVTAVRRAVPAASAGPAGSGWSRGQPATTVNTAGITHQIERRLKGDRPGRARRTQASGCRA